MYFNFFFTNIYVLEGDAAVNAPPLHALCWAPSSPPGILSRAIEALDSSIVIYLTVMQLKRKAMNITSTVQDTFYSTKDVFERNRVVFTISTCIALVATMWTVLRLCFTLLKFVSTPTLIYVTEDCYDSPS